jgi:hypothetical protein
MPKDRTDSLDPSGWEYVEKPSVYSGNGMSFKETGDQRLVTHANSFDSDWEHVERPLGPLPRDIGGSRGKERDVSERGGRAANTRSSVFNVGATPAHFRHTVDPHYATQHRAATLYGSNKDTQAGPPWQGDKA